MRIGHTRGDRMIGNVGPVGEDSRGISSLI